MAPARRSARGPRNSRRSAPAGRSGASARTNARAGSSRRTDREEDDPRSSGRRSARESARGGAPSKDTTVIVAGVVGAVVILGAGVLLFSGRKRVVRREERAPVPTATRVATIDFFQEGMSRGYDWKSRMKNRQTPFTETEVREVADRMTSDYTKKGIDAEGERRFKNGFVRAVLGK